MYTLLNELNFPKSKLRTHEQQLPILLRHFLNNFEHAIETCLETSALCLTLTINNITAFHVGWALSIPLKMS